MSEPFNEDLMPEQFQEEHAAAKVKREKLAAAMRRLCDRSEVAPSRSAAPLESRTSLREKAHENTSEFDRNFVPDLQASAAPPSEREALTGQNCESSPRLVKVTDANYGNDVMLRADHITACTIVAETTYREGKIPDGTFRRTLIYTVGGNQLAVRETPEEIWLQARAAVPQAARHPELRGTWPENCVQRAFVEGAKWWEFYKTSATMWQSDQRLAEKAAVEQYGEPGAAAVPAPGLNQKFPDIKAPHGSVEYLREMATAHAAHYDHAVLSEGTLNAIVNSALALTEEEKRKAWGFAATNTNIAVAGATAPPKEGK